VLVGADAVGDEWFVNKVGTAAICALAIQSGVPVYVLAGRDIGAIEMQPEGVDTIFANGFD